jgi:hypothetical protein
MLYINLKCETYINILIVKLKKKLKKNIIVISFSILTIEYICRTQTHFQTHLQTHLQIHLDMPCNGDCKGFQMYFSPYYDGLVVKCPCDKTCPCKNRKNYIRDGFEEKYIGDPCLPTDSDNPSKT